MNTGRSEKQAEAEQAVVLRVSRARPASEESIAHLWVPGALALSARPRAVQRRRPGRLLTCRGGAAGPACWWCPVAKALPLGHPQGDSLFMVPAGDSQVTGAAVRCSLSLSF